MKNLWDYDKFWVIWASCADRPRTLKEIQRIWRYEGNSLYQKGINRPIWKEMVDEAYVEERGTVKQRGVYGTLIYARMEWIRHYLDYVFTNLHLLHRNDLGFRLWNTMEDKKMFIKFLEDHRTTFYFIDNLRLLFGDKETLRAYGPQVVMIPLAITFELEVTRQFSKMARTKDDVAYAPSKSLMLSPLFNLNYAEYFRRVVEDIGPEKLPEGMISVHKLFSIWKDLTASLRFLQF